MLSVAPQHIHQWRRCEFSMSMCSDFFMLPRTSPLSHTLLCIIPCCLWPSDTSIIRKEVSFSCMWKSLLPWLSLKWIQGEAVEPVSIEIDSSAPKLIPPGSFLKVAEEDSLPGNVVDGDGGNGYILRFTEERGSLHSAWFFVGWGHSPVPLGIICH